jgi:NAD dependent epimerase/dehydratase
MTVLVTGAGGFIGSHVTELLLREGRHVRALARYNGRGDVGHLNSLPAALRDRLAIRLGDVADPFLTRDLVDGCDAVLHLAALIGIPYSYVAPASYFTTNVSGTLNVLEACRQSKVRRVVVTSTSEVYGTALYTPMDEGHPLQSQSPYSASKIAADKLAESYFRTFDVPVVTLRPFNTFGPRQSARAVIPTILSQCLDGKPEIHIGNVEARRDWVFVDDTARAFLLAADAAGVEGEVIHFGTGVSVRVGDVARMCLDLTGSKASLVIQNERMRPASSEVDSLVCDASKANRLLGWLPTISLEEGLVRTADYMRKYLAIYSTESYVV